MITRRVEASIRNGRCFYYGDFYGKDGCFTPLPSGVVKAKTGNETDSTVYAEWYKAVYMPTLIGVNTGE